MIPSQIVVHPITSQSSGMSSEVLERILKAGKVTGTLVVLATEEVVSLPAVGTGALDPVVAVSTGEDVYMLSGDAASLKLLAELEDMLKLLTT